MTILNLTGLLLSFAGSFVLLFCAGQPVQVTKEGLGVITWTNSPAADEKAANKRRYWIELTRFRAGAFLLSFGFLLQLIAAIWS